MAENSLDEHLVEGDEAPPQTNRRSLGRSLLAPSFRVGMLRYFVAGGIACLAATIGLIYWQLASVDQLLNTSQAMQPGGQAAIYDTFANITGIALAGFCLFIIYASIMAVIFSHRVAGPIIALLACIDELKKGNFEFTRELRKNDLLHPVHEGLKDLGRTLKARENSQ